MLSAARRLVFWAVTFSTGFNLSANTAIRYGREMKCSEANQAVGAYRSLAVTVSSDKACKAAIQDKRRYISSYIHIQENVLTNAGGHKQRRLTVNSEPSLFRSFRYYFLCLPSSETVSFFLPLALLEANTLLPLAVDILFLKPCLFLLFLFEG